MSKLPSLSSCLRICLLLSLFGLAYVVFTTPTGRTPLAPRTVVDNRETGAGEEGEEAEIREYFQYRFDQMKDASGTIPDGALMRALGQRQAMVRQQASRPQPDVAGIDNVSWTYAGPGNVGGRIRAILPINATTVFVGGVSGGLWKTTNCCSTSTTWTPIDDWMANLAISSLLVDPTNANVMYAGTGEGFGNADAIRGAGVFKSIDGGATWTQLSSTNNSNWYYVNRLAISLNGASLLAVTRSGIYRSTDGGSTWSQRVSGNYLDVRFDPSSSNNAVASGSGFSRYSTDGGENWIAATGLPASGRIELAYAPSNSAIVYASVDQSTGAIYKSTDGGHSYSLVNAGAGHQTNQGWYDNTIWVNPTNPNNIVVAGLDIYQSINGGTTFTKISAWGMSHPSSTNPPSPHADHHALVSIPGSSNALLNGNDGGLYYTSDISTAGNNPPTYNNGWVELNNNLGITQFYGVAGNHNGVLYGGSQDNGVEKYTPGAPNAWVFTNGGDGGKSAADPTNPNYLYNEYIYGKVNRSTASDGTAEDIWGTYYNGSAWVCRDAPYRIDDACNGAGSFIAPILLDPNNANRLFVGDLSLWVSNDVRTPYVWNSPTGGPQWAAIKPSTGSRINAIAVAPGNSNTIWVGYSNSHISKTVDGGLNWVRVDTNITPGNPGTMIGSIAIDKNDSNIVYVGFTGFGSNRVWRTADGGATWSNITGNLPQAPIYAVAINPANSAWLYVGTEIGVFASENMGGTWNVPAGGMNGDGPANVAVEDLQWMGGGNSTGSTILIAGTHGRGAWTAQTITPPTGQTPVYADDNLVCGGNSPCYATITEALANVAPGGTVTIYAGNYPESVSTALITPTVNITGNITVNDLTAHNGITWNAGSYAITVNNFNLFGGTWNAGSSILTVNGDWTGGGTFNAGTGAVVFAKNGVATASLPGQTEGTLSFCNLTINASSTVDTTDDFISAATGGSCTTFSQNGKLRREAPQQWVANYGAFTFKDARNRDSVILQRQSGGSNLRYTDITITSNQQPPSTCGASPFPTTPVLRQFDLTWNSSPEVPPYGPYRMRLYFSASNPNEANGNTVTSPYNLAIYHCNGTSWEKFAGTGGSDANGVYVETTAATWSTGSTFAIGPAGTIYYSQGSSDAGTLTSWNSARNGSGSGPLNFTGSDIFVIQNGHSMTTANAFTLSHTDSLLQIESSGALTINASNVSVMGAQIDAGGTLTVNSGRTLTINNGSRAPDLVVNGTLINSGTLTSSGTAFFGAGSVYQHNTNGGTIPTATWDSTSTVLITGITANSPSGLSQSFGNLTWNNASQTTLPVVGLSTINGNFTMAASGSSYILLSGAVNVGGNFVMTGGGLYLTYNNNTTVNVSGNVIQSGGTLRAGYSSSGISILNVAGDWTNTGGTFTPVYNSAYSTVNFTRNGVATVSSSASQGTLTFCNLTISANTTVDAIDDYISVPTGTGCGTYTQSGKLRREPPTQNVNTTSAFTFKDARNRDAVVLTKTGAGTDLGTTNVTVTSNLSPTVCGSTTIGGQLMLRSYDIAPSGSSPYGPYTVRLYFSTASPNESNGISPSSLSIYHCKDNTRWEELNGNASVGSDANGSFVQVTGVTSFSPFGIGAPSTPLAINIEFFTAERTADAVQLAWETVSEIDNAGFNLYRTIDDEALAPDWVQLNAGLIPSQSPGSSAGYAYEWLDATAASNVRYRYRMDAVDLHGSVKTVGTVTVEAVSPSGWRVWLPLIGH